MATGREPSRRSGTTSCLATRLERCTRDAPEATGARIGYFVRAVVQAALVGVPPPPRPAPLEPGYAWRDGGPGRAGAARLHTFQAANRQRQAVTIAGSEHFPPELHPGLRNADVYLGWAGRYSLLVHAASPLAAGLLRVPGAATVVGQLVKRLVPGSTGGPDAQRRAATRSLAVAEALDSVGTVLARTILRGPSPYDLTAELLAWGAVRAACGRMLVPASSARCRPSVEFEQAAADIGLQRAAEHRIAAWPDLSEHGVMAESRRATRSLRTRYAGNRGVRLVE